jgi:hypothetical protein
VQRHASGAVEVLASGHRRVARASTKIASLKKSPNSIGWIVR